jgi:hypothetical protein
MSGAMGVKEWNDRTVAQTHESPITQQRSLPANTSTQDSRKMVPAFPKGSRDQSRWIWLFDES